MELERQNLRRVVLTLPQILLRLLVRAIKGFLIALGMLVVLSAAGYFGFESIVETIDSRYPEQIDAYLGIDRNAISRLHDPAYFAEQSTLVTEDLKTVACISSPEHRILINDVADIPPLFISAILASEDKNFFTHEGIDKARDHARAGQARPPGEPLRRIDAHDADRQASSRRHRSCIDRDRKDRRHRHGASDRARVLAATSCC